MKKNQIIICITELSCGEFDCQQVSEFEAPYQAWNHIESKLKEDLELGRKSIPELDIVPTEGTHRMMWDKKEGNFAFAIGSHDYKIAFLNVYGESRVSDEEMVRALEGFTNSSRTGTDYKNVAETATRTIHRYCQSQLWRFIKKLIEAIAKGGFDDRNRTAHDEAGDILEFMETHDIV